jgi:hypothetical protein
MSEQIDLAQSQDSIFRTFYAEVRRSAKGGDSEDQQKTTTLAKYLFIGCVGLPLTSAIATLALWQLFDFESLRTPSYIFLLLTYLGGLGYPLLCAAINWRTMHKIVTNPLEVLIENAHGAAISDAKLLAKLDRKSLDGLELAHIEIKLEREAFDKRLALTIGQIEKLGLFPGLLATFFAFQQSTFPTSGLALSFAYAVPVLYVIGALAQFQALRLDRISKIIELTIKRKSKGTG